MVSTEHSTKHEGLLSVGPHAGAQVARETSPEGSAAPGQGGDSWEFHRSEEARGFLAGTELPLSSHMLGSFFCW